MNAKNTSQTRSRVHVAGGTVTRSVAVAGVFRALPHLAAWICACVTSLALAQESASKLHSGAEPRRPRTEERRDDRLRMVREQIEDRGVRDPAVLEAMRNVPRHWFVPANVLRSAYDDRPLPIGEDQTISQPYIVAFMTKALKLDRESKVLEVGTGSGYQAAVLAEITPQVFTIEIVEPLGRRAMEAFKQRGYESIQTRIGDGYAGWPEHAPFDAIIVTCAPGHVPPKLVGQLKPGGRLCIPVGPEGRGQKLLRITKNADGTTSSEDLLPVSFVPMTGEAEKKP